MYFDFSLLKKMIDSALAFLDKQLSKYVDKIVTAVENDRVAKVFANAQERIISRIENSIAKIQEPKFTGDVVVDTSSLEAELQSILTILRKPSLPDFSRIEKYLAALVAKDNTGAIKELLSNLPQATQFPSTIKIDEMQMRTIASRGLQVKDTPMQARNVKLTNVSLATANTEYTHVFSSNVVGWELRVRDTDVPLLVAYITGKLPTSGDGAAYFTVPAYYIQTVNGIDWSGKTIYLQTGGTSQVVEVIEYKA